MILLGIRDPSIYLTAIALSPTRSVAPLHTGPTDPSDRTVYILSLSELGLITIPQRIVVYAPDYRDLFNQCLYVEYLQNVLPMGEIAWRNAVLSDLAAVSFPVKGSVQTDWRQDVDGLMTVRHMTSLPDDIITEFFQPFTTILY